MTKTGLCVAIDFGSTYTKLAAFDLEEPSLIGSAYTPTTPADVRIGLKRGLDALESAIGSVKTARFLACSSARGGLRIVVVGLVPRLSTAAATQAALGAGGKIVASFGRRLSQSDVRAVEEAQPDLVVLAGGTDGGDEATIEHNAAALAKIGQSYPMVVAGNQSTADRCQALLADGGHEVTVTRNILPDVATVDPDGVRVAIRDLFMKHIVRAKGIDQIADVLGSLELGVIPTPTAVLSGAELIARGPAEQESGIGETVVVDVGGATTDVYSIARGMPREPDIVVKGLPEPFVKRTVEGDLGLRVNARSIVEHCGLPLLESWAEEAGWVLDGLESFVERCAKHHDYVPSSAREYQLDAILARAAVAIAARRHAGTLEEVWSGGGRVVVLRGKDLRTVRNVIGVGGVLVRGRCPQFVLEGVTAPAAAATLLPEEANIWIDSDYALFGVGLLAQADVSIAEALMRGYRIPRYEQNKEMGLA